MNGVRYDLLPKALLMFKDCANAKEYIESIEAFAYRVLVENSISNEQYFKE